MPEDQFLKLKAEFPDRQWSGQDPRVDQAIRDGITEDEKRRIADELGLQPWIEFQFNVRTPGPRYVDETKENPSFEVNGKKFWIFNTEQG